MVDELKPELINIANSKADPPECLSLAWSADGQVFINFITLISLVCFKMTIWIFDESFCLQTLFAGYADNLIRVWQVSVPAHI